MLTPIFLPSDQDLFHFVRIYSVMYEAARRKDVLLKDSIFFYDSAILLGQYLENAQWDKCDRVLKSKVIRNTLVKYPDCFKSLSYEDHMEVAFNSLERSFQTNIHIKKSEKDFFQPLFNEARKNLATWFSFWHENMNSPFKINWVEVALDRITLPSKVVLKSIELTEKPVQSLSLETCCAWISSFFVSSPSKSEDSHLLEK